MTAILKEAPPDPLASGRPIPAGLARVGTLPRGNNPPRAFSQRATSRSRFRRWDRMRVRAAAALLRPKWPRHLTAQPHLAHCRGCPSARRRDHRAGAEVTCVSRRPYPLLVSTSRRPPDGGSTMPARYRQMARSWRLPQRTPRACDTCGFARSLVDRRRSSPTRYRGLSVLVAGQRVSRVLHERSTGGTPRRRTHHGHLRRQRRPPLRRLNPDNVIVFSTDTRVPLKR